MTTVQRGNLIRWGKQPHHNSMARGKLLRCASLLCRALCLCRALALRCALALCWALPLRRALALCWALLRCHALPLRWAVPLRRALALRRVLALLGATALASAPAAAHVGTGLAGGFSMGFVHPLSGADHLLAMVAVGLWGAVLGRPLIYALPVIFPGVMVLGAILGMLAVPMPSIELGIALSVVVLGACISLSLRAPVWAAALIVGTFAVFHGYAHGQELPSAADPIGYSIGFVLATGLLHVMGICVGFLNERPAGVAVTRGLGGLISLTGMWFLLAAAGP